MDKLFSYFSVIPCKGKVPLVSWADYVNRQPTDEEQASWERQFPDSDKGIICGAVSRIFVLDVDGEEGERSIANYHIPRTASVRTPHGRHYYFRWIPELDDKVTTKVGILDKVDVRGQGGFVRFYGWELGPHIAPLMAPPQWLLDLLPDRGGSRTIENTFKKLNVVEVLQNATEENHNRNASFAQLAGSLRAKGFEFQEIYEFLLPKAQAVRFDAQELQRVCQSICRYPAGQRPALSEVVLPTTFESFLSHEEKVEYIVPGILAKNSIAFVAGLPETCKTWTLVDLAIELGRKNGGQWLNKYPVKPAKVLYIDQERAAVETRRRFQALISAKNIDPKEFNDSLAIQCGTTFRLNLQPSFDSFRTLLTQVKPDVILVDSFKTIHTCDINNNMQMQDVMERVKALKNEFDCLFAFIYHENKGAHERVGSDGKKKQITFEHMAGAAVMSEVPETILITVKQDQNTSWLHHVKNTYGQKIAPILVSVEDKVQGGSQIQVTAR